MSHPLTAEQQTVVSLAQTGENLVVTAGAGAGKTSTLVAVGSALAPRKGLYIAYNKAIQVEASTKFPANVLCKTSHSLAFGAVGRHFMPRIKGARVTARQAADILDIDRSFPLSEDREISEITQASLAMQTVGRYCNSDDAEIMPRHVPMPPGVEEHSWDLANHICEIAQRAWKDLQKVSGKLRFTHDMYLKLWALGWNERDGITGVRPTLRYDFIFVDEAQDSNPCVMGVLLAQDAQLIAVGDRAQAIYGWRGAVDSMRNFPAENRATLSKSFRFGQAIADVANQFLRMLPDNDLVIEGFEEIPSTVGPDPLEMDAILCRTNAGVIQAALDTPAGQTFAIVGGTEQIVKFAEAAASLIRGQRASWHPELSAFKSWQAVCDYADEDGDGADLRVMVNLVRDYGVEEITRIAMAAVPENRADRTISTAHKAKGREWDSVQIGSDFTPSDERQESGLSEAETMLAYVAVTRAKKHLDIGGLSWAVGA